MASEMVEKVMAALEKFYDNGSGDGDVFEKFCKENSEHFTAESSATEGENKLEWTEIYKKFSAMFESHI